MLNKAAILTRKLLTKRKMQATDIRWIKTKLFDGAWF